MTVGSYIQSESEAGLGLATVRDAQEFLSVSRTKIYALMDAGELPFCKVGRCRRIPRRALHQYAEKVLVGARE